MDVHTSRRNSQDSEKIVQQRFFPPNDPLNPQVSWPRPIDHVVITFEDVLSHLSHQESSDANSSFADQTRLILNLLNNVLIRVTIIAEESVEAVTACLTNNHIRMNLLVKVISAKYMQENASTILTGEKNKICFLSSDESICDDARKLGFQVIQAHPDLHEIKKIPVYMLQLAELCYDPCSVSLATAGLNAYKKVKPDPERKKSLKGSIMGIASSMFFEKDLGLKRATMFLYMLEHYTNEPIQAAFTFYFMFTNKKCGETSSFICQKMGFDDARDAFNYYTQRIVLLLSEKIPNLEELLTRLQKISSEVTQTMVLLNNSNKTMAHDPRISKWIDQLFVNLMNIVNGSDLIQPGNSASFF